PTCDGQPFLRREDPMYLAQRRRPIGKELKTLLANRDIEGRIRERESRDVAFSPIDRGRNLARGREHAGVDVNSNDCTGRAQRFSRETRDDPRAARDVEYALTRSQRGNLEEIAAPWLEDRRHEVCFVILWRTARNLPLYLGAHEYLRGGRRGQG